MRNFRDFFPLAVGFLLCIAMPFHGVSQTYTPKDIRVEGAECMDVADLLHTAGFKVGLPITKEEIEAGLQRLADTGMFTDISYTVGPVELVLKLSPSAAAQLLPVRYTNFVWWKPGELTPLIQSKVPLYQGKLPRTGSMVDQVEAALKAMLKEKGITDAEVTSIESMGGGSMALAISRPSILLGTISVQNSLHGLADKVQQMQAGYAGQEFDLQLLAKGIPLNVSDLYHNAGYLDATADAAVFAAPRKDGDRYLIDASTSVQPGDLYHIRKISIDAPPPLSKTDLAKAALVKSGDAAGAFDMQHGADALAHAYFVRGYLDAKASVTYPKDAVSHTVDCMFAVTPGDTYHLKGVDTSQLSAELQAAFAKDGKLARGIVADDEMRLEVMHVLNDHHSGGLVRMSLKIDHGSHLLTVVLTPGGIKH